MGKYTALDVASYLKFRGVDTNIRIQKLLYFLQAQFLINSNGKEPLFDDPIEAWPYGPVVRCVFNDYKKDKIIPRNVILAEDKEKIDFIIDYLKKYSDMQLVNLTHMYTPWKKAWEKENEKPFPFFDNEEIEKESIYNYHIREGF